MLRKHKSDLQYVNGKGLCVFVVAIHFDEDNCDSGVTGGNLRSMYILHEMHFHWESEHTVDGRR